jgi:hypothetical protein
MDTRVAEVTVSVVNPDILPDVAVNVVEPAAIAAANPFKPVSLLMVPTAPVDVLHVTAAVMSCVVLSENVPVAVNCWIVPFTMLGLVGVTAMDTSTAGVTVTSVNPQILPHFAVILAWPGRMALIFPGLRTALAFHISEAGDAVRPATSVPDTTSTALASDDIQVTTDVMSFVVLSEKMPVAKHCWPVLTAIVGLGGVTEMVTSCAPALANPSRLAVFPPHPARIER